MSAVVQTPRILVRPMTDKDLDDVMLIELAEYTFPWTQRIFDDCLRIGYRCHVAEIEGVFAGYAVMSTGAGEAHILNLCIAKDHQRLGLARTLLQVLLEEAEALDVHDVFLEVRPSNVGALMLYEQFAFNQVGVRKNYYPSDNGREDAIILAKSLRF